MTQPPAQAVPPLARAETPSRIADLPKEAGVMLVSVGAMGLVLPAMAGIPALVAGGLVLWPRTFGRVERWASVRFPTAYREGMRQIGRYLDDFERRFPDDRNHGARRDPA